MSILGDPEKLLSLSNALYIIAAVLTIMATLAIVYFGNKVTTMKQQQLKAYQTDADARIAEANAKAAQAHSAASAANQRAEEAQITTQQLRLDTAKIEHDNLLLREQLNSEHDARLVIEKKITQRGLTMAEIGPVRRATYPLGVQPIDIVFYKDDAESRILASNLAVTFEAWKITLYEAPGGSSHQVDVSYDPRDLKAKERARAIFEALQATNKLRVGGPWESLPSDIQGTSPKYYGVPPTATIRIIVGYR